MNIKFFLMLLLFDLHSMEEAITATIAKKIIKRCWSLEGRIDSLKERATSDTNYKAEWYYDGVLIACYDGQKQTITTYFKNKNKKHELNILVFKEILSNKEFYLPKKNEHEENWCWIF